MTLPSSITSPFAPMALIGSPTLIEPKVFTETEEDPDKVFRVMFQEILLDLLVFSLEELSQSVDASIIESRAF